MYDKTGMNRREVRRVLDLFMHEVKAALVRGCVVELRGFGTFEVKVRKARPKARNPKTGESVSVLSHGVVAFRPGRELKHDVWNVAGEGSSPPNGASLLDGASPLDGASLQNGAPPLDGASPPAPAV